MLTMTAVGLILVWLLALVSSFTMGGWIHLLPVVAVPLFIMRMMKPAGESEEYSKWKQDRARRGAH